MFFEQKLTAPIFALALSRAESNSGNGGYLSIGGIPDLNTVGVKNPKFASTPIRILPQDDQVRYYLINIDGPVMLPVGTPIPEDSRWHTQYTDNLTSFTTAKGNITSGTPAFNGTSFNSTSRAFPANEPTSYILDSGTTLSFLPSNLVYRYVSMFHPPARFNPSTGFYFVDCQAQVPPLGVKIGEKVFWHKSTDLIKQYDYAETTCIMGVQDSGRLGGVNILGDTFLDNVLAVFDLGEGVVRVAGRRDYSS